MNILMECINNTYVLPVQQMHLKFFLNITRQARILYQSVANFQHKTESEKKQGQYYTVR